MVSPVVTRLVAPLLRARRAPLEEPVVILSVPQDLAACPYCGVEFTGRVAEVRPGKWVSQKWCMNCQLRFL